jgi:hypothetical protein
VNITEVPDFVTGVPISLHNRKTLEKAQFTRFWRNRTMRNSSTNRRIEKDLRNIVVETTERTGVAPARWQSAT